MKEAGLTHWLAPNIKGINFYGFTALPGGLRDFSGNFNYVNQRGDWWSSTSSGGLRDADGYSRYIYNNPGDLYAIFSPKKFGISIRCLKD